MRERERERDRDRQRDRDREGALREKIEETMDGITIRPVRNTSRQDRPEDEHTDTKSIRWSSRQRRYKSR